MSVDGQRTNTRVLSRENILSIYVPAVVLSLGNGIAVPAIPVFAQSFDVSFGVAALVFVVHMLGGTASTIPTGLLIDRIGRRKIILAGPLLVAISSLLTATATSFELLLVYRFIGGWAQQMWMLGRLAHIADTGGDRQRGRQITGMMGLDTIGRLLGPGVGGFLALWDIRAPFVAHGVLSLLAIVPSYLTIRESAPSRGGRADRAAPGAGVSQRAALIALLTFPVLVFFVAQLLASMTRGALWGGTVNLYPVYAYGIGPETLGLMSVATGVISVPIVFSTGAIMDRFGRKKTVVPGFFLLTGALGFAAFTAYSGTPFGTYVVAYMCFHAAQSVTSGNMQVMGSDLAPAQARGVFFGVWRLVGEVGQTLSPVVFALLAETVAYGASFAFLSAAAFVTAIILLTQVKETLKRDAGDARTAPEAAGATVSRS